MEIDNPKISPGFTIIELLIVVIIIALLSAIVVPQFSNTSNDAKLTTLKANLKQLRTAIDLYTLQHGHYPGAVSSVGICAVGNNTDTATPGAAAFVAHMSQYTTSTGIACSQKDGHQGGLIKYGPYLRSSQLPVNPITGDDSVEAIQTGDIDMTASGNDSEGGWRYDFITGQIIANQPSYDHL